MFLKERKKKSKMLILEFEAIMRILLTFVLVFGMEYPEISKFSTDSTRRLLSGSKASLMLKVRYSVFDSYPVEKK